MRGAAATGGWSCRSASAASACRRSRRSICAAAPPPRGRFISPRLAGAVKTALERGEQALLFLNRRGYAPLTLCRACGFRFSCPNCDAWLVDHRFRSSSSATIAASPCRIRRHARNAMRSNSFVACGPGVERLEEEARELFPDARMLVLSSDLVASVERMREEFADIAAGRFDIVIGTQLVAKGHHFPDAQSGRRRRRRSRASATAIRAPPSAPSSCCIRSIGRAGREAGAGRGFLQTHQPEHPVMRALIAQDREAFYSAEIDVRERDALSAVRPPRLDRRLRPRQARHRGPCARLARAAPQHDDVRVLGPAEAPLALVRGRHRLRLLVKAPRDFDLSAYLRDWLAAAPKTARLDQARHRCRSAEFFVVTSRTEQPLRAPICSELLKCAPDYTLWMYQRPISAGGITDCCAEPTVAFSLRYLWFARARQSPPEPVPRLPPRNQQRRWTRRCRATLDV